LSLIPLVSTENTPRNLSADETDSHRLIKIGEYRLKNL